MTTTPFEPGRYLTRISGADYLEVRWRIVWLKDRHPDASIESELVRLDQVTLSGGELVERAIFKATITIPGDDTPYTVRVTDYGSETSNDFRDFMEKASTKAIGRACALAGFGTQFAPDIDDGSSVGRVVDSPVDRTRRERSGLGAVADRGHGDGGDAVAMAQPGQVKAIESQWQRLHRDTKMLGPFLFEQFARNDPAALTQEQAGKVIVALDKELQVERAAEKTA